MYYHLYAFDSNSFDSNYNSVPLVGLSSQSCGSSNQKLKLPEMSDAPPLLKYAHDYGYSNSESLNSMGILTKVSGGCFLVRSSGLTRLCSGSYRH